YLDCVETLRRNPVANLDADASWLASFFLLGKNWASGAVLVLLGRTRNGDDADPAALFSLSRQLTAAGPLSGPRQQLADALEAWHAAPSDLLRAETDTLTTILGVERSQLLEHLHHRRLLGHGTTFADALLEPLRLEAAEEREAAFLRRRLTDTDLPERQR